MKMVKRQSGIELLRCILMFLIVLHHSAYHGVWGHDSSRFGLIVCFTGLTFFHVNAFIAISGWFGIKFRLSKLLLMWATISFYLFLGSAYEWFLSGRFVFPHSNWFIGCYLALFMAAPFLNAGVDAICTKGPRFALACCGLLSLPVFVNWMPGHLLSHMNIPSAGTKTLYCVILIYVVARVLKKLDVLRFFRIMHFAGGTVLFAVCVLAILAWDRQENFKEMLAHARYNAPHVLAYGFVVLLFFAKYVKVSGWMEKVVLFVSPSMFAVFLIHEVALHGRDLYQIPQRWFLASGVVPPWMAVVVTAVVAFASALLIDLIRRGLAHAVVPRFAGYLKALDVYSAEKMGADEALH